MDGYIHSRYTVKGDGRDWAGRETTGYTYPVDKSCSLVPLALDEFLKLAIA